MSTEREYDVAVVGASLAGSTVATLLGRAGARVALIEGHADPSAFKRTCTHYIQASGAPVLERLGALPAIELAGGASGSLEIWSRYGWVHPEEGDYSGWNIRRERLDPLLRGIATSTEGVDAMLGETVVALRREGERVTGVLARSRGGEEREIRAHLVVGADGRDSTVARLAGLPERVRPNNRFGYWAYFLDLTVGGRLWMLDPDVAYTFPTDGGLTLLACLLTKDRLPEFKADPEAGLRAVFGALPDGPSLEGATLASPMLGKLDVPNVARRIVSPGLALVGDAAMASDPLWGVGCGWALQSGEWLAEAVAPALTEAGDLDEALRAYRRRHRRQLAAHHTLTSEYSSGRRFNPVERIWFRAAARDRFVARRMQLYGERWITPRQLLSPRTLARVMRAGMRPTRSRPPDAPAAQPSTPVAG
jgi:flavin-dependent dehydrogenase